MEMWIIWLAIAAVCIVVELTTTALVSCWGIVGALVALILSFVGAPLWLQIVSAIVITIVCLVGFRRFALKVFKKDNYSTNSNSLIGTKTRLLTAITEDSNGSVKINDVVWTAKSVDGTPIPEGVFVKIDEVSGNKLLVSKVEEEKL